MKWTAHQQQAITKTGNLLVSAAAGSGKTAVLTERIARLILEGAEVEDFLVVTFTRSAAAEMKKRISSRLCAMAEENKSDTVLYQRLSRSAQDIGRANISTIDSFCAHVLRRHFQEAGLDPAFRAADEAETELLKQDALEELLEQKYGEPTFGPLVDAFGDEEKFIEGVFRLHTFINAQPDPIGWLKEAAGKYAVTEESLLSSSQMREYILGAKGKIQVKAEALRDILPAIPEDYPKTADIIKDDLEKVKDILSSDDYLSLGAALSTVKFATFNMRGADKAVSDSIKKVRDAMKDEIKKQAALFAKPLDFHVKRLNAMLPLMQELCAFMEAFIAAYTEKKQAEGVIDYGDMEHIALKLLTENAEIAEEYRSRFKYLFVDEYQDCNPVQDCIFNAVKREDNLFLVGDVKQSIYRFRMAEPALFSEKLESFTGDAGSCIHLSANFRSSKEVIDCVNRLFTSIMTKDAGGIDYDENAMLRQGRDTLKGAAELHIIPRTLPMDIESVELEEEQEREQMEAAECEAVFTAGRIRELVNSTYTDEKGKEIKYNYGDIVILHSAPKSIAETWVQTLAREGVPAYAEVTGGYFDAVEVQIFLNLLRLIDNPIQDIPLLSVLRSPICGFTTEELIDLRVQHREDTCYASLLAAANRPYSQTGEKARVFLSRLNGWRNDAELYTLTELIAMLLDDTGFETYACALPGGASRKGNLEAMLQAAAGYAKHGGNLHGFLKYMDRVRDTGRMGSAQTAGANVVRLISIHKSKGLEFPVVFLAGLSKQFNDADKKANLVMDTHLGIGFRPVKRNTREKNIFHEGIANRTWSLSVAEQMRVLYVALTRAAHRLIMVDSLKDVEKELQRLMRPMTPAAAACAKRFDSWVIPAFLQDGSGDAIREYLGLAPKGGEKTLEVFCHDRMTSLSGGSPLSKEEYLEFTKNAREKGAGEYRELFAWQYPNLEDTLIPSKISVSEHLGNISRLPEYPIFLREQKDQTATDKGTAAHAVMEHISLTPHTEESIREEIAALTQKGILTPAQAEVVDAKHILSFFDSPLGRRLTASQRIERELAFNHRVKAKELSSDYQSEETLLLQGIIDCCFVEEGEWVLLDYKTDRVPAGKAKQVARRHAPQLNLYKNALEELTGIRVKEMYVCLLRSGDWVKL